MFPRAARHWPADKPLVCRRTTTPGAAHDTNITELPRRFIVCACVMRMQIDGSDCSFTKLVREEDDPGGDCVFLVHQTSLEFCKVRIDRD